MKYQVGDTVLLIHSNEEGKIIDILDNKMVMVDVKGARFPVYLDQIDFPYFKRFSQKKMDFTRPKEYIDNIKKEKTNAKYKVGEGVWLALLPVFDKDVFDDDIVEKFRLYLVNQTENTFAFTYELSFAGEHDFELTNEALPLSDFYLHDIAFEKLNDNPKCWFEFSLTKSNKKKAEYYETFLKLKAKQVFQKVEEMKLRQEASFSFLLFEKYPDRVADEKPDLGKLSAAGFKVLESVKQSLSSPPRTVVDLHIEKLSDAWQKMSNDEKLDLQLKTFEKYYDLALQHRQSMLIVVHGIGKGRLREEIHDILRNKKEVKSFVNQFHPSFGYGATEIYF
ncbi:MAG: Smr/MutS family protein [Chitinophagaceae bacterium]|nr:Smr/MutS family protein [Chitinophagaceae bacterium]